MQGLVITDSPDISFLDFLILYDISGGIPSITLTNQSISKTSPPDGLANCTWWYTINTPSGVSIHAGSQLNPDVTLADWTNLTIPANSWPTPFGTPPYGQIEFSCGTPYIAVLYVMDSEDHIYSLQKQVTICRPNGNTEISKGNFGAAKVLLLTNCQEAQIRGTDTTDYTYQKIIGTSQASTWTLAYPMNADGQIPDPFVVTNKPSVIFPVGYNAPGYQLYMNTYSTYDMGNGQSIKVQYKFLSVFSVWCNVNMCAIQCEIDKMYAQIIPNCGTLENAAIEKQLFLIGILMDKCIVGIQQPLCGIDVPATIEEIKRIGKFICDCGCEIGQGINSIGNNDGPIVIDTATAGAITASVTNVGANYTIHLAVPGSSGIPDLQEVTTIGAITNLPVTVGVAGATNSKIESDRLQQQQSDTEVLSGVGRYIGSDTWGSLWLRKIGQGVVILRPHATSNTYVLVWPASQGGGNTFLKNDGAGNLSWGVGSGNLQTVTDGAGNNVTTNAIISGLVAGANGEMSDTQLMLFNVSTQLIGFLINSTIPTLRIGGVTSGFANIVAAPITTTYQMVLPATQGAANTFLRNDGAGNLLWDANTGDFITLAGPITYSVVKAPRTTIICDTNFGDVTINVNDGNIGQIFSIKNIGVLLTNKVVINIVGGGNIDIASGVLTSTTYLLTIPNESVIFVKTATNNTCRLLAPNERVYALVFANPAFTGGSIGGTHGLQQTPGFGAVTADNDATAVVLAGGYSLAYGSSSVVITFHVPVVSPIALSLRVSLTTI